MRGFDPAAAWQNLLDQVALGVRAPGSDGHRACADLFEERLTNLGTRGSIDAPTRQTWTIPLFEREVTLTNLLVRIPGTDPDAPSTLLGSHYDARWIADHDPDRSRRGDPIPAANDGGSGTAVLLELAAALVDTPPTGDVHLAFFDGEDLGDVDGFQYAEGSRFYVANGPADVDRVIALDMVGGRDMRLNIEGNSLLHEASRDVFVDLFQRGRAAGRDAFFDNQERWIYSDHGPFLDAGIPALCLIDIDYPQWHTHADLPDACHPDGLEQVGATLLEFLRA